MEMNDISAVLNRLHDKVNALEKERDSWNMLAREKEKIALALHNQKELLEAERDTLRTRVLDLSSRLGFVMGSLQGLRCHNLSELTRTRLEEAIKAAEDQGK